MAIALTLSEAADLAAVPRPLLQGLIALNQGPKARRIGNRTLILTKDLESWLESLPETRITTLRDELREALPKGASNG